MSKLAIPKRIMRCAIYTRVSSDAGLEQDFNSLDAQREAAEAFIKSQSHEGWRLLKGRYNDGGFSGGSMDRPSLKALLADIRDGKIDIVVVYKVDRLTRALSDFAKLVELFDDHDVSFVSVTQSFNTTSSMGRLTLNVLLSFAQFEREVTGERIRDKIAASKKKGIWMGGIIPLGYRVEDRKLLIEEEEARIVRLMFDTYCELKNLSALQKYLRDNNIRSRIRRLSSGKTIGGVLFTAGPLATILRNRVYLGEINHQQNSYPGEHQPIIAQEQFDCVQTIIESNRQRRQKQKNTRTDALLADKIFDDLGNRMSPGYAVKKGVRYRYYVSRAILQQRKKEAGSAPRVPAQQVENVVTTAIGKMFPRAAKADSDNNSNAAKEIRALIDKVIVSRDEIQISTTRDIAPGKANVQTNRDRRTVYVPWSGPVINPRKEILLPSGSDPLYAKPMRSWSRSKLIIAIATARRWLNAITSGKGDIETIAKREGWSKRHVSTNLTLAFLDPTIVKAAVDGKLPKGFGITRLTNLSPDWAEQRRQLGL